MNTRTDLATRVFCSLPPHPLFSPPRTPKRFLGDIIHAGLPPSCIYASSPCIGRTIYRGRERAAHFFAEKQLMEPLPKSGPAWTAKLISHLLRPSFARRRTVRQTCKVMASSWMIISFFMTSISKHSNSKSQLERKLGREEDGSRAV